VAIISNCTASIIKDAAFALKQGHLVAFPTETVYGLGADATNEKAVARIYEVKGRPKDHPLIVHISSIELLDKWATEIPDYAIKLARNFWPGPMTLILPRTGLARDFITGGQDNVGIRVPANNFALALLKTFESEGGYGIAAPSANKFGALSPTNAQAVQDELENDLLPSDLILDGGCCEVGIESTIIDCTSDKPEILRPGAVTLNMVENIFNIKRSEESYMSAHMRNSRKVLAPGMLISHYAPKARVYLGQTPIIGQGMIAIDHIKTPLGVVRLAAPKNDLEFAKTLYEALRSGDRQGLKEICVIPPNKGTLKEAIFDRLNKSASSL
jgi:L-threonylcarbamoyladenylate synthase